jgi:hypothetical protein
MLITSSNPPVRALLVMMKILACIALIALIGLNVKLHIKPSSQLKLDTGYLSPNDLHRVRHGNGVLRTDHSPSFLDQAIGACEAAKK